MAIWPLGIIVLNPDGTEQTRITSLLFLSPANAAFDDKGWLLVVNHPNSEGREDPMLSKILRVFVDDAEAPLNRPDIPWIIRQGASPGHLSACSSPCLYAFLYTGFFIFHHLLCMAG